MIGMSFASFLTLLILGLIAAMVVLTKAKAVATSDAMAQKAATSAVVPEVLRRAS